VFSPNHAVISPNHPTGSANQRLISRKREVISPNHPMGSANQRLVSRKREVISANHPMGSANQRLVSRKREVISATQPFSGEARCFRPTTQGLHDGKWCCVRAADRIADGNACCIAQMTLVEHARNDSAVRPPPESQRQPIRRCCERTCLRRAPSSRCPPSAHLRRGGIRSRRDTTRCCRAVSPPAKPVVGLEKRSRVCRKRSVVWRNRARVSANATVLGEIGARGGTARRRFRRGEHGPSRLRHRLGRNGRAAPGRPPGRPTRLASPRCRMASCCRRASLTDKISSPSPDPCGCCQPLG